MHLAAIVSRELTDARVVFDIGAHRGMTVLQASQTWPGAKIFAFEPVSATYEMLIRNVSKLDSVSTHRLALGDAEGKAEMRAVPAGFRNRILQAGEERPSLVETVSIMTGDKFCAENGVETIDYMKIDAEGHDLKVLHGFEGMFRRRAIRYVRIETGISPYNEEHVGLADLMGFFTGLSYGLVGLYGPRYNNPNYGVAHKGIYYCDSLFVAEDPPSRKLGPEERQLARRAARLEEREARRNASA